VWKTGVVLALTALTLIKTPTMTAATNPTADITRDDSADGSSASVARSGTVSHGPIAIHPFIDVAAIENSKTEIFVSDAANNVVNIYNTSGKADRQGNGCMNPERWQQIRDLLEQALELAPEQRAALLDRSCVSDPSLRQEVEVLLAASDDVRSSFLQSSITQGITLTPGTKVGEYEVKSLLGTGGMGEVYHARDSRR
jgi:hypothetical protein